MASRRSSLTPGTTPTPAFRPNTSASSSSFPNGRSHPSRRPGTSGTTRASTSRARSAFSTLGVESQDILCAVSESRGVSPSVGLAFVNLDTGEAVLSQFTDSQTYIRTIHKLVVFNPSSILIVSTAQSPDSKLLSIIYDSLDEMESEVTILDRRYWSENAGIDYIRRLAFVEDVNSILTASSGNYFAVCCFAAVLKHLELDRQKTFSPRSLRIKYEPSEGSMMIGLSTIRALELVQNLNDHKSKHCLFGLLNKTLTPMGSRLLRSNILQPLTDAEILMRRFETLEELSTKEEMFTGVRTALKQFKDVDKFLTSLILIPKGVDLKIVEQSVNNVILLKDHVNLIQPVFEALAGAQSDMLLEIRGLCNPARLKLIHDIINETLNADTRYASKPLDLQNQRTYAVISGTNGLLDVSRTTYKEALEDVYTLIGHLEEEHKLPLQTKFTPARGFFLRLHENDLEGRALPSTAINVFRSGKNYEFQTLEVIQQSRRIAEAHMEVMMMSDKIVRGLIDDIREHMAVLFKVSEAVGMLDMISSFAQLVSTQSYTRPSFSEDTLSISNGRHPIRETIQATRFVANNVFASPQHRLHIITGCNMSGKSTYIRSIALMSVMAQIGCFVPADVAIFTILHQLFARISTDDNIEANSSTFATEMRETAFILRNIDSRSLAIIDELGRGTSTRDGLAIALAIAEALVASRAMVWFVTHFHELASIMQHRAGVRADHMKVHMNADRIEMLYRLTSGSSQESHYGLALAKAATPLPPVIITRAERISQQLEDMARGKKKHALTRVCADRRKLILSLKEHLVHAKKSTSLQGEALREWLKQLQVAFVVGMGELDELERGVLQGEEEAGEGEEGEEEEGEGQDRNERKRQGVGDEEREGNTDAMSDEDDESGVVVDG